MKRDTFTGVQAVGQGRSERSVTGVLLKPGVPHAPLCLPEYPAAGCYVFVSPPLRVPRWCDIVLRCRDCVPAPSLSAAAWELFGLHPQIIDPDSLDGLQFLKYRFV